jgi:amino acid transporter
LALLLLAPFVALCLLAWVGPTRASIGTGNGAGLGNGLVPGLLVAMWNFMGWDNASTVAGEVERPRRTYPWAVLAALALVVLTYLLPIAAASRSGVAPQAWTTGSWVDIGRVVGGSPLAVAIVLGGMVCGLGMMDALVMSYSRLPMVMAQQGFLPRAFARTLPGNGAPWVAIVVLSVAWSLALGLGFERLIELDIILYGLALLFEFVALVVLRVREPTLPRPFRVPGGLPVAILLGVGPAALLCLALVRERQANSGELDGLVLGVSLAAAGLLLYPASARFRSAGQADSAPPP